ncbi:hypothetical protein AAZV13_01G072300 [Glycine max]
MEDGVGRGLECPKTMDGKASNRNGLEKDIPSCCLKARAPIHESEVKCHSTVVSGWFSASQTCPEKFRKSVYFNNLMWPGNQIERNSSRPSCCKKIMQMDFSCFCEVSTTTPTCE